MKLSSQTKASFKAELVEYLGVFFGAVSCGAMLCWFFDAMNVFLLVGLVGLIFSLLDWKTGFRAKRNRHTDRLDALRWRGLYPAAGTATEADVKRVKDAGYKIEAVKLYREMHPTITLREAVETVDAL